MKWLMTLLGIFRSASKKIVREQQFEFVLFENLSSWLSYRSDELIEKENLNDYLTKYIHFLKDKRWLLKQQMEEGKSISEDLFSQHEELLQMLSFDKFNVKEMLALNSELEDKLEKILPDEGIEIVNPSLKLLSEIDNARKKFTDTVNKSGYPRIANLSKRLSSLNSYKSRVDKCEEELRNKRRRLYLTEEKKNEKEKQLGSLHDDSDSEIITIRKKKETLIKEVEEVESSVSNFFSEVSPLLQRYSALANTNGMLDSYIRDPLNAFLDDESLSIKHSLQHLRAVLNSGKFSWSVEENISSLEKLDSLREEELEQMHLKLLCLKRQLENMEESSVEEGKGTELDDTEYRLQHFTERIEKLEEDISSLEEKAENLKEEFLKEIELVQNMVKIGFGIELEIKV